MPLDLRKITAKEKLLEFSSKNKPGFWEVRGYHNHGDAFKEERHS